MFEMMHAFFTWSGTGSVPFASSYRLTSSRNSFREVFHVFDLGAELVRHDLNEQSRAAFLIRRSVHQAQLSVSFDTVVSSFPHDFRAPFCVSIVSKYSKVADCCSCGGVAITTVGDWSRCFQQGWIGWIERTCVSVEREVPVVKVSARCERLWLSDSHVLWARFRHRLSHRSHSFRESCHCCVHRSARRLLTNFFHSCSELLELTSQHLNCLSGCHHHSAPQFQDNMLRYHARVGNNTHPFKCAVHNG